MRQEQKKNSLHIGDVSEDSEESSTEEETDDSSEDWQNKRRPRAKKRRRTDDSIIIEKIDSARKEFKGVCTDFKRSVGNCLHVLFKGSLQDCLTDERIKQMENLVAAQKEIIDELRSKISEWIL
jgi:hypothetical protein